MLDTKPKSSFRHSKYAFTRILHWWMEKIQRELLCFTLFSLSLLVISVLAVFMGFDEPCRHNVRLVFGLILWPPALITFSGCLCLMLSLRKNDAFAIGLMAGIIWLVGTAASVLLLKSYHNDGHVDWGVDQGLLPAVTFASTSMAISMWMVSKLADEQRQSLSVYMLSLGVAVLTGFLLSLFFLWALLEFLSIAVASGLIWGWAFDQRVMSSGSRDIRGGGSPVAFPLAYFVISLLILAIPFFLAWSLTY